MTEAEWLACSYPHLLLDFLDGKGSDRKLRLFACACCRRVWSLLWADKHAHAAVTTAERCADGLEGIEALAASGEIVRRNLELYPGEPVYDASYWACGDNIQEDVYNCAGYAANNSTLPLEQESGSVCDVKVLEEQAAQSGLLREIFGNPFRQPAFEMAWATSNAVAIAQAIYTERAFDRLPILADALEDAGCTDAAILNHCRQPGEHARGCWVVDLALGKE